MLLIYQQFRYLCLVLLYGCVSFSVFAEEPGVYSFNMQTLGWDLKERALFVTTAAGPQPLEVRNRSIVPPFRYVGPSPMVINVATPLEDGSQGYRTVASVPVDRVGKSALLLLSGDAEKLKAQLLPGDALFEASGVSIYNLSESPLAFQIEDNQFALEPRSREFLDLGGQLTGEALEGIRRVDISASIAAPSEAGEWRKIYQKRWTVDDRSSLVIFVVEENERIRAKVMRNRFVP